MKAPRSEDIIDLRGEIRSRPTPGMWHAMQDAEMGWAAHGEDEDVKELERRGALLTGQEAALFVWTTSMANLLAMLVATEKGDQIILESDMHLVWMEGRNLSYVCSLFPRLIGSERGEMPLDEIELALTQWRGPLPPPRTSLIGIENTHNDHGGTVLSPMYVEELSKLSRRHGCRLFMDGARIFNAAVSKEVEVSAFTKHVDLVSVAFNKGLGAPVGSLLCGNESHIDAARERLRQLGASGNHRGGLFAAAALYALENMSDQLSVDHSRARTLADGLRGISGLDTSVPESNQVKVETKKMGVPAVDFVEALGKLGILAGLREPYVLKFMLYHEIDDQQVNATVAAMQEVAETLFAEKSAV